MSFVGGRHILAIPGPTPVPERILNAMSRAGTDIYAGPLIDTNHELRAKLRRLAETSQNLATYIGNGHAGWEAATRNILAPGDKALVVVSGHFGEGWASLARGLGVEVIELSQPRDTAPDPDAVTEALANDPNHEIRAVLIAHAETSTGSHADIPAIRRAMGDHPALLAVDAIATIGCQPLPMDEWGIDVIVGASQKGLMCPPGVAPVWFSDRAASMTRPAGPYWDWTIRNNGTEIWHDWGGTPPVHMIWALNEALTMMEEEGLAAVYARHKGLAEACWAAFDRWGADNPAIGCFIKDPAARALSVTAAQIPGATALRAWCEKTSGLTLGVGLAQPEPDDALRVAHMGGCSAHMLLGTLAVMEAGMTALDIPHGLGAVEAAAAVIARLA